MTPSGPLDTSILATISACSFPWVPSGVPRTTPGDWSCRRVHPLPFAVTSRALFTDSAKTTIATTPRRNAGVGHRAMDRDMGRKSEAHATTLVTHRASRSRNEPTRTFSEASS